MQLSSDAVSTDALMTVWSVMVGLAAHTHIQVFMFTAAEVVLGQARLYLGFRDYTTLL